MDMHDFEPLVGEWQVEIRHPDPGLSGARGRQSFEWLTEGSYLIQRSGMENPAFPSGVTVIGPTEDDGRIAQHYFDSRGVARLYETSIENGVWKLWRDDPEFRQRTECRFSEDGNTITCVLENSRDGGPWQHDFEIVYTRLA